MIRLGGLVLAAVLSAALAACGSSTPLRTITVFAGASLKQTFIQIGDHFKADNAGASVEFSFAGSSTLSGRLTEGATADVFASADIKNMDKVAEAGLVAGRAVNFASNSMVIAVAAGNPKHIGSFTDLARPGLDVVVCAPPVPCGAAAQRIEDSTGVRLDPVSKEASVLDVLNKVASGRADAGLVYVTDALAAGSKVTAVRFPEAGGVVNDYSIAVLNGSKHPDLARAFMELVIGGTGQQILGRAGFAKP